MPYRTVPYRTCSREKALYSVMAPLAQRQAAWARLAAAVDSELLERWTHEVPLEGAIDAAQKLMAGESWGRVVVAVAPSH